jgi:ParB family chromosome partitioning protein
MVKRPDFRSLAARIIDRGTSAGDTEHPVDTFLADEGRVLNLAVTLLRPNPDQPRKHFDEAALAELTDSVRQMGVLQPVIARRDPNGTGFILIAGERRWRAAKAAGLAKIPTLVRGGEDALEVAIVENAQRRNLNPIEEAETWQALKDVRDLTDADVAKIVGKSRSSVTETLSLNTLPDEIKAECRTSDRFSKSQLLEILRAGTSEVERLGAWNALKSGQARTVRALRSRAHPQQEKRFHRAYNAPGGHFRIVVEFRKADVTADELRRALNEAADHLT